MSQIQLPDFMQPPTESDGPFKTYSASCHCGAVKYTIKHPSIAEPATRKVVSCNCSGCQKFGNLGVYPLRHNVEWQTGFPENVKVYQYATKQSDFWKCKECGCHLGIDPKGKFGPDLLIMSVRMVNGLDLSKLDIMPFNGREYVNPEFNDRY